ncbi:hypothetical protein PFISCL1PPCAC_5592 [Pristionchus fissidentatus]|uniref:Uncharacterized protein n=1 Tax=Pristionchus fissidentatus TaxID=1538716 RepID=A0AAV5V8R3_9BILA|nr:hypothetical protein PFISCL1PPCAC_5592 [Pristionchus fissidentatus]
MDDKNKEADQDGSNKNEGGETEGAAGAGSGSADNAQTDDDPLKKAFQSALNAQNQVAENELETKEKVVSDGHAMTARDDMQPLPQQENADNTRAQTETEDDGNSTSTMGNLSTKEGVASPVATPPQLEKNLAKREATAMDENDNKEQQPSSDTGEESQTQTKESQTLPAKKTSKKRKKKKKKKVVQQQMPPPPFYQFPFFALLPQVQAQERRKRVKKKDRPSSGLSNEDTPPTPAAKPAPPAEKPAPPPGKKIEAVKIQQKEDDNGYLNLADLQAKEKEIYGEKMIGAPGEEYICLAEANEAAGPPPPPPGATKDGNNGGAANGKNVSTVTSDLLYPSTTVL